MNAPQKAAVRKILAGVLLLAALAFVAAGAARSYKVYDDDEMAAEFGIFSFETISERQLVIDATFSGTLRKKLAGEYRLISNYDRTEGGGKRACPT